MLVILIGLVLFVLLGLGFWISGIFFAVSLIAFAVKWGFITIGVYLLLKEIRQILR